MRLMQGTHPGASALVCLHCGTETESKPPYRVEYCNCRSAGDRDPLADGMRDMLPPASRAA